MIKVISGQIRENEVQHKHEIFVKHACLPKLKGHCDLDL